MKNVDSPPLYVVYRMLIVALLVAISGRSDAQTFPADFSQVAVATGISNPTVMTFASDGRIFVAQQNGALIVVKNGAKLPTPAIQLTVNSSGERGLIGIALHPDFASNGFVYLYYTLPNGSRNRVSRFTMSGDVISPGSEVIILNLDPLSGATNHNGGAMHFKGDKLYIAVGENADGDHAQDLDTYHGKLLRVNSDGSAPEDNPFNTEGASEQRKRVWAYGLRNPYTFDVQPVTQRIFVNDVGQNTWEEINDATIGGNNYGWPSTEGATSNPAFTAPEFSYPHGSGDGRGCAITGGVFFNPTSSNYPASFTGKYFYQDLCNAWINYIDLTSGVVRSAFATGLPGQSLALDLGTDGNLYYLSRSAGSIYKIIYSGVQTPAITDQPDNITVAQGQPATFQVSASGTSPLAYQWRKNGDDIEDATSATYTIGSVLPSDAGNYSVEVSNSAGSVVSEEAVLTVTAFNARPVAIITTPEEGALYRGGDVINFSGSATDPEDGELPESAFTWSVVFHHAEHVHDGPPIAQGTASGSFTIPNSGETSANVFYRLYLVVTDSEGLKDSAMVDIEPRTTTITLTSNPPGLQLTLDGQPATTPFSELGVEGILRTIGVVSPQTVNGVTYTFANWSHGGSASQSITTPEPNTTYTANFSTPTSPLPAPWLSMDIGNTALEGEADYSNGTFSVSGSGNDIGGTNDAFHFVYQRVTDDFEVVVRVASVSNTDLEAKAGVMIRQALTENSKHVMVSLSPAAKTSFHRRKTTEGVTSSTSANVAIPYWLRIVRVGYTFTAYRSANGVRWVTFGSVVLPMNSAVYVGFAVTSHTNNALCTATFTHFRITPPSVNPPPDDLIVDNDEPTDEILNSFTMFPNPLMSRTLTVESTLESSSAVRIQIVNMLGQVLQEQNLGTRDAGVLTHELDMSDISQGTYLVRVVDSRGIRSSLLLRR